MRDEPVASKELIRALRKEAPISGTAIRLGWLALTVAISTLLIVAVFGTLVLLEDIAEGKMTAVAGGVLLAIIAASVGGATLLIRRHRN